MRGALWKGALTGGIILFVWSMLSWIWIPWHRQVIRGFVNETQVASALRHNAPISGMYILPDPYLPKAHYTSEEVTRELAPKEKLLLEGPVMFAAIQAQGMRMKAYEPIVIALSVQILGAGLAMWMLLQARRLSYFRAVWFVTLAGALIWLLGVFPFWIWWGFSLPFVYVVLFDTLIGWMLAGLAMACWRPSHVPSGSVPSSV